MANVEKDEMAKKVREEEDFIHAPKHQNSLQKFLAKNDKPLDNGAIGRLLMVSEEEVEEIYEESIVILREEMVDEEGTQ